MATIDDIKTVVIVLMENRSFDHMLGYLSLPPSSRIDVDGQSADPAWLTKFANQDGTQQFQPFHNDDPYYLPAKFDPPHQRENVAEHLGVLNNGTYAMNGFVAAIPQSVSSNPDHRRLVMGYFGAAEVPINDFFATNFTICDRWFCAVPSGTQPNRLMAMGGASVIERNATPLPPQPLIYDWLDEHNISWCVYHQGIPFFTMMLRWVPRILAGRNFRPFDRLKTDLESTPPSQLPQVIFVEPDYGDAPHFGRSTDDHAPSGVSDGQEFLMQVYNAVTSSRSFWNRSLTIMGYDEHGGFFDHVSPPLIRTAPPNGASYNAFLSLGPRTPAYVLSPFVNAGACAHDLFDHTSVLKFIAEKFGNGSYSLAVDTRPVESLSKVLTFENPITSPPPAPAVDAYLNQRPPKNPYEVTIPFDGTELQNAFMAGATEMKRQGGDTHPFFGRLLQNVPA
ncbi:MAG TPA: alkaline phosphatase family protein [Candidatus Limnocylindrales bacterium]|nr:alkaline phosphatase family protein [Candidatus Limnocylindrales bacterium]